MNWITEGWVALGVALCLLAAAVIVLVVAAIAGAVRHDDVTPR